MLWLLLIYIINTICRCSVDLIWKGFYNTILSFERILLFLSSVERSNCNY